MMTQSKAQPLAHTNVVIIGTGIGGAGISALLAKAGATPVVLERSSIIGGLYIVGADTGDHGIGTERAASSALAASELILEDLRELPN
ncbi:MAG: hypothetical protein JRG89_24180 [Deltaproteobacteria bacterium]|nr:hypothetical protein [Deltaproteobacteria bacterium]